MERVENDTLAQAEAMFRDGKPESAIEMLRRAAADEPENQLVRVRLADFLRREGKVGEAIATYRASALEYADMGALPFAVALYKVLVPLLNSSQGGEDEARGLLRELVRRYQKGQKNVSEGGTSRLDPSVSRLEIPLFADMSREELETVIQKLIPMRVKAGTFLFKEGDEGATMFIVTRGYVRVSSICGDGKRIRLAKLGPGDFFGEWSLLTGDYRRHALVESETDVELLELSESTLEEIKERFPRVGEIIVSYHRRRTIDTLLAKVFPTLSSMARRRLAEHLKEERYSRGTILYREGDTSEYMSIIQHGTVEVYTFNLDGVKIPLALLGPGQYFGEGGALSGKPRVASVRARTDAVLHHVSREDLVTALVDYPEVLSSLQGVRVERIGATLERLEGSEDFEVDNMPESSAKGIEEDDT